MKVVGVILAGGRGRRLGGADKALVRLAGETLLVRVAARFAPQVAALALSANGPASAYAAAGLPVLPDAPPDDRGPLAGVLAGLDWAAAEGAEALATVAVDTPFLPLDLVARLVDSGAPLAMAESGGRRHPTAALWPVAVRQALSAALDRGDRRLGDVAESLGAVAVAVDGDGIDPFFNINTAEDLALAEAVLRSEG
ncbi:molybdenum cofactor guanylyltransferase MobA [Rhodovulum euryhalinum]|uniref:Molybdenum cofactor guanylyltransferase n=1 Tax=Rhodovulum euryhalinum TaxID=35805 RepID=A0A4R2KKJ5_9RHOB|nr:molybdenum cofactor guanylyltransferase MobA [Rhodovulum euryhalinum]TCO71156.1 molybdenum cofactor guanylyltransferase [Rhodovulum euryhalinum]